jgi:hypothetical protein
MNMHNCERKRSNPFVQQIKDWIASSLALLAKMVRIRGYETTTGKK